MRSSGILFWYVVGDKRQNQCRSGAEVGVQVKLQIRDRDAGQQRLKMTSAKQDSLDGSVESKRLAICDRRRCQSTMVKVNGEE